VRSRRTDVAKRHEQRTYAPFVSLLVGGAAVGLLAGPAFGATPLNYLTGYGTKAYPVVHLTWGLLIISIVVTVIMTVLVVVGTVLRRSPRGDLAVEAVPIERSGGGLKWISIGVGISSVVLVASLVWTMAVMARVNSPPATSSPLTIEITGQQWWWKARYLNDDPSKILTTANEIHIPVGRPVRIKLIGADVIHSFWVPALAGKTDAIPGQTNETWLQAARAGRYRGLCSEYCGAQHSHMAFFVTAEAPDAFQAWLNKELAPAPSSSATAKGQHAFEIHCGACHTVRGTLAGGSVAPDLTHLMSRETLAAGTLPNTPGNLSGWIANPQSIKPESHMPNLYLSGPELTEISTYLETLK
jgi:cytochrome c oxidase subunit II